MLYQCIVGLIFTCVSVLPRHGVQCARAPASSAPVSLSLGRRARTIALEQRRLAENEHGYISVHADRHAQPAHAPGRGRPGRRGARQPPLRRRGPALRGGQLARVRVEAPARGEAHAAGTGARRGFWPAS